MCNEIRKTTTRKVEKKIQSEILKNIVSTEDAM